MSEGVYPKLMRQKVFINNLHDIKKYYKPKLLGITQIDFTVQLVDCKYY